MDSLKLAQLMCSRLCHDLITPVGAISTGLEIISESGDDIDPELLTLTVHSSQNAAQRLVYYRAAFGYTAISSLNTPDKLEKLLKDYLATYKINLEWGSTIEDKDLQSVQDHARILVNIVGLMTECAPYGGHFKISITPSEEEGGLLFSFELTGDLVNLKSENRQALTGQLRDEDVTPHSVQSYLTHTFIEREGAELSLEISSTELFSLTLKTEGVGVKQYGSLF